MALQGKQKAFVFEYLKSPDNAYQAALRAGYKKSTAKEASKWINPDTLNSPNEKERKKFKPAIYEAIKAEMDTKDKKLIADGDEVLRYLTSVMRKESRSSVLARNEMGADVVIEKPPDEKEALKAGELLGKVHMLFTEKVEQQIDMNLNITVDYGDEQDGED